MICNIKYSCHFFFLNYRTKRLILERRQQKKIFRISNKIFGKDEANCIKLFKNDINNFYVISLSLSTSKITSYSLKHI